MPDKTAHALMLDSLRTAIDDHTRMLLVTSHCHRDPPPCEACILEHRRADLIAELRKNREP